MANLYPGLARGPIDHNASSVINSISNNVITMGDCLRLAANVPASELLPRVETSFTNGDNQQIYGIAVGGDIDGIYGDGAAATTDLNRAANAGESVVVVTQGRCLARVAGQIVNGSNSTTDSAIIIGDALVPDPAVAGRLVKAPALGSGFPSTVIARALQDGVLGGNNLLAIDVQREGVFT